ncbi:uncharacterized protein LOC129569400 [Sitodiplosis mosellana]|uniref:uncharacterized protein LOC129569400 n=1 Tax=Sitodiplosis mosellana TaxID=263140 RepID=UPI0024447777|nr:uncharacterized protein LOC129569400 [Sitodiplosis mosellana]
METMEPREETKLTDLDIDCLERICRYLPLEDLLNVADSSKQLKKAADLAFLPEYSRKYTVRIGYFSCNMNKCEYGFKIDYSLLFNVGCEHFGEMGSGEYTIEATHLKRTYQTFRCFGHLISKLEIGMKETSIHFDRLMFYIKEYCAESLTQLAFLIIPDGSMIRFVKPFPNIHTLYLTNVLNVSFGEIFPNLKHLKYIGTVTEFTSIESEIPNLEHLELYVGLDLENVLLRKIGSSPKIRTLIVPGDAIYQGINEILPNLKVLRLHGSCLGLKVSFGVEKFHFATVKRFEMCNYPSRFEGLPFSFDNLEEFIIEARALESRHEEELYDFISEHPSIKKLGTWIFEVDLLRLMDMLPLLGEFDTRSDYSIHDVARFMNVKESLKKMTFYLIDGCDIDIPDIQAHLNDKWHGIKLRDQYGPFEFTRILK